MYNHEEIGELWNTHNVADYCKQPETAEFTTSEKFLGIPYCFLKGFGTDPEKIVTDLAHA